RPTRTIASLCNSSVSTERSRRLMCRYLRMSTSPSKKIRHNFTLLGDWPLIPMVSKPATVRLTAAAKVLFFSGGHGARGKRQQANGDREQGHGAQGKRPV